MKQNQIKLIFDLNLMCWNSCVFLWDTLLDALFVTPFERKQAAKNIFWLTISFM